MRYKNDYLNNNLFSGKQYNETLFGFKEDDKLGDEEVANKECFLDDEIGKSIESNNPFWLNEYLGISLEKASEICEEFRLNKKISLRNLKTIMFARDRKKLDISTEKVSAIDLGVEELEGELDFFNNQMLDENDSAVKVEGKNSEGKKVVLFYYPGSLIKGQYNLFRQIKIYNEHDDVEALQERVLFANGAISSPVCALVAYKYDANGKKIFSIYDDEVYGGRYHEYDRNGKIVYLVGENDYRNITTEMATRLSAAFCATRHDFENMDNSVLEEKIDMLNGNIHQRVNNDDKIYDDR